MLARFPNQALPALPTITCFSPESMPHISNFGVATPLSNLLQQNRAYIIPFHLEEPIIITKLFCINGATVNGNFDIGIYSSSFVRLLSTGSTAQAGTNAIQAIDVTDTVIGPGDFYMALATGSATATFFTQNIATTPGQRSGMLMQNTAFALPATLTPITITSGLTPIFGLRCKGTVI